MQRAVKIFDQNIERVRSLHALHLHFTNLLTPVVDLSDLLRTEIVLTVSALDQFVHEITRIGMIEIWKQVRAPTAAYLKFPISLHVTSQLAGTATSEVLLEAEIRERHGFLAFQQPEKIADAVRLFSPVELWSEVGLLLGEDAKDLKAQLKLVVDRRNKIAHEADIDPSFPGQRWPIARHDTEGAFTFIEKIGHSIARAVQ